MSHHGDVLIVGAGPVGLLLALELTRMGAKPRLIGRRHQASAHSRATILWPRTLELLNRVGLDEAIIGDGHCFDEMSYYSNMRKIGSMRLDRLKDTPYRFGVIIPQWKTETLLQAAAEASGVSIEYGTEFIGGYQSDDFVRAHLRTEDSRESTAHFTWLVGADGYRSTVRTAFGFDFDGFELGTKLAITDAQIVGDAATNELAYYMHKSGNLVLAPLGDGVFRVGVSLPRGSESPRQPSKEFFERLISERASRDLTLGSLRFSGVFDAHVRTASSFQNGRVFIAGDAAHAMSPSGAQGLNTGLQDAVNLAWKLAGVLTGRFAPTVLQTYSIERQVAVRTVSRLSTRLARMSLLRSPFAVVSRDAMLRLGSASGLLDRYLTHRLAQFDTNTVGAVRSRSNTISEGDRVPLIWQGFNAEPKLAKCRYTMILWPGVRYSGRIWDDFVGFCRRQFSDVAILDFAGRPTGSMRRHLPDEACAIISRPDGHVAALVAADREVIRDALGSLGIRGTSTATSEHVGGQRAPM